MKRILLLSFMMLFALRTLAQRQLILADAETKKAIPFALINFDFQGGAYSNENGIFTLNTDSVSQIEVSFLGYEKVKVSIAELLSDTIFMEGEAILLNEVLVHSKEREYTTDFLKIRKETLGFAISKSREMVTRVYPQNNLIGKLKEVRFSFEKRHFESKIYKRNSTAIIRINIYKNDSALTKIYSSEAFQLEGFKKDQIAVDLSEARIYLEIEGLAFGLEYIGHIDENGELLQDAKTIMPNITTDETDDFNQTTFMRSVFNKQNIIIPSIDKFITKNSPPDVRKSKYKRNLAIAFTVIKY